jgi:C4-type Zn-finger protein
MENDEKSLQEAQEKLNQTLEEIKKTKGNYSRVVIYLTDEEGNSLVKGSMEYENILALEKLHAAHSSEVVGMLFTALEAELKQKYYESQSKNTENESDKSQDKI